MIDYSNTPSINNHQTFFALGSTTWQTWQKPKNCKFVYITAIGGGGGGGSSGNVAGTSAGGGGGGASSITSILIPAALIPDTLYVQVGMGGTGGSGASVGSSGGLSTISILPNTTATNVIIQSGSVAGVGGSNGNTSVGSGTGGAGGTVFTKSSGFLSNLGTFSSIVGDVGGNAGYGTNGSTKTALSTMALCGGGGGAGKLSGTDFAGGSILAGGVLGRVAGGTGGVAASNGNGGIITIIPNLLSYSSTEFPFASTGGSGAGSNQNGTGGGNGGNGAIGSGGGGAGALVGGTGRVGGNGGNGIVFITTF